MSDELSSKPVVQEKEASQQDMGSLGVNAPSGNDNAEFYRWVRRGMVWAIVPSIFIGKNFHLFMYIERSFVIPPATLLVLVYQFMKRYKKNNQLDQEQSVPKAMKVTLIEKTGAFYGGFGIGLAVCVAAIMSVMSIFKL